MTPPRPLLLLCFAWAACSHDEPPPCPAEEDRFVPMTASMDSSEPPEDTAADRTYVMCPDENWVYVERDWAPDNSAPSGFEVARADPVWVAEVEGFYCFSWMEFQAWAIRIGYDYAWGNRGGLEGGPDWSSDSVIWCEP